MFNYYMHKKGGFYRKLRLPKILDADDYSIERTVYKSLQKTEHPKGQLWDKKTAIFDEKDRYRPLSFKEVLLLWFGMRKLIVFKGELQ